MKNKRFIIPSLLLAGFSAPTAAETADDLAASGIDAKDQLESGANLFRQTGSVLLAGHGSHRSHSSHSSHSSHRSSSGGGGYYPPATVYTPAPLPAPPPPSQRTQRPSTFGQPLNLRSTAPVVVDQFIETVRRVQRGLKAFGYYQGDDDGSVGPETRSALSRLQTDYGLKVTGTITPEVLSALNITF